jgi:hypothetical protein
MAETGTITKAVQCEWPECGRTFKSPAALQMHVGRTHTRTIKVPRQLQPGIAYQRKMERQARYRAENIKAGLTSSGKPRRRDYPSESSEAKHRAYLKQKARFHAMGLTAQGKPVKKKFTAKTLRKFSMAQKLRRQREMLNGVTPEKQTDSMGESARAIILAAQVLRSVSVGLKI